MLLERAFRSSSSRRNACWRAKVASFEVVFQSGAESQGAVGALGSCRKVELSSVVGDSKTLIIGYFVVTGLCDQLDCEQ